jgi:hypothetical protein
MSSTHTATEDARSLSLNMTPREIRAAIYGKPRERAKWVGKGFAAHWEYRGIRIGSRRKPGWNSGSIWWSDPINGVSLDAKFKDELLARIDAAIDAKSERQG